MRMTFVIGIVLTLLSVGTSADDDIQREREIAFQSGNFQHNYKRAVLRAAFVKAIHDQYTADKSRFYVFEPRHFDDRAIPGENKRQLSEKEVVDQADNRAKIMLDGYDLRSEPYYDVVKSLVGLLPYRGNVAMDIIAQMTSTSGGRITEYDPGWYRDHGRELLASVDDGGALGERIHSILLQEMNFDAKNVDWSESEAVKDVKEKAKNDASREILSSVDEWLELQKKKEEARRSREIALAEKRKSIEEYENTQANIVGYMEGVGYAFQLLGKPEDADRVFKVAKITTTLMDLNKVGSEIAAGAMVSGYLGVVVMAVSLFSKEEDGQLIMMEAMLEAIYDLREEMHERFDAVDGRLAQILVVQERHSGDIKNAINELRKSSEEIEQLIDTRSKDILAVLRDQGQKQELTTNVACTNYRKAIVARLDTATVGKCINYFDLYSNEFSMLSTVANSEPGLATGEYELIPYGSSVQQLAQMAILYGADGLAQTLEPTNSVLKRTKVDIETGLFVPNPNIWLSNSSDFLSFLDDDDTRRTVITPSGYDNFIDAGAAVQRFYKHLLFDDENNLREDVFDNILDDYREAGESVYTVARQYAVIPPNPGSIYESKQPHIDLANYEPQMAKVIPLYFFPTVYGETQDMSWCDGKQFTYDKIGGNSEMWLPTYDPVSQGLTLDTRSHHFLNERVKLYEWLGLGKIKFCLRDHSWSHIGPITPTSRLRNINYSATVGVRFQPTAGGTPIEVANWRVSGTVQVRYAHKGAQHTTDMVWNWSYHKGDVSRSKSMADTGWLTAKEALTRPARVTREDLMVSEAFADTQEQAEKKLEMLRRQQTALLESQSTDYKNAWVRMDRSRELIFALYEIGLRPYLDMEERRSFVGALSPSEGVLGKNALVNYGIYGTASTYDRTDPEVTYINDVDWGAIKIRASTGGFLSDLWENAKDPYSGLKAVISGDADRRKQEPPPPEIIEAMRASYEAEETRRQVIDEVVVVDPALVDLRDSIARFELMLGSLAATKRESKGHPLVEAQLQLLRDSKATAYAE